MLVIQSGWEHLPVEIWPVLLLCVSGVVCLPSRTNGMHSRVHPKVHLRRYRYGSGAGGAHQLLRVVQPVIHLVARMPVPLALHHCYLRPPRDLHDLGTQSRVRPRAGAAVRFAHFLCLFRQDKIIWECQNGGQLWSGSVTAGYGNTASFPDGVCAPGFHSLYTAFIVALLVDLGFQVWADVARWPFC